MLIRSPRLLARAHGANLDSGMHYSSGLPADAPVDYWISAGSRREMGSEDRLCGPRPFPDSARPTKLNISWQGYASNTALEPLS
ncbi:hypothetical protein MVEN_00111900 [Mycena venus]|uniref:Uncharacterized protein n=1 Tax=Mycena venus TaxID=2733690 RepID=A0A8H6ZA22_9AGAR|nr:hypothetical protein MVEN_00111900 [Mycena venus]